MRNQQHASGGDLRLKLVLKWVTALRKREIAYDHIRVVVAVIVECIRVGDR
jgi:hypothetical protein